MTVNDALSGKKKLIASVGLPIAVGLIQAFVQDPEQAKSLIELVNQYFPTIIALIGGIGFTVVEGINDQKKITPAVPETPKPQENATSAATVNNSPTVTATPEPVRPYAVPFDVTRVKQNADPFLSWEQFEDYFYSLDLRDFNPEIAFEFANQILDEGFRRAGIAWKALFEKAKAVSPVRVPVTSDFQTSDITGNTLYRLTEAAEQEFNELIPSECSRLAYNVHNINQMVVAFAGLYKIASVFDMLEGKKIDWKKVATINDIARLGLGAV